MSILERQAELRAANGPLPSSREAQIAAATAVARITIADKVRAGDLEPAQLAEIGAIFPTWQPGITVAAGDLYTYGGEVVECVQGHTTQADWAPAVTPALWKVYRDPDAVTEWVQPTGSTDAYAKGAQVTFEKSVYESLIDANTWSPTGYPSGWKKL